MARRKRSIKQRIAQHFDRKQHVYIRVLTITVVVVVVVIGAQFMVDKEGEHEDVVVALSGTSEEKYQMALTEAAEGDIKQARIMMERLARLGDSADKPLGYGPAHLWVATDSLKHFSSDFMWSFPGIGEESSVSAGLVKDSNFIKAQRHLAHAVALNPESESAALFLAATYAAQGKRNDSLEILMNAVALPEARHIQLHIPFVHVLATKGDDLALQERAWHLFSSLGETTNLGRGKDVSERVRYVMSALILNKYENADIAIRRLEARFGGGQSESLEVGKSRSLEVGEEDQVRALRMAYHYHRAIGNFKEARVGAPVGYEKVVDELEKVVKIWPDCDPAIDALSYIATNATEQKARVKLILEQQLNNQSMHSLKAKSKLSLALALVGSQGSTASRKYLEASITANPENDDAMLRLIQLMGAEEKPDYASIEELAKKLLKKCKPIHYSEVYMMLGMAQSRMEKWNEAIASLEQVLARASRNPKLHSLLEDAYRTVGKVEIAEAHRKAAQGSH